MGLYRRLARSKKGMSTIFGGLFFIILLLMGFNLMLWGFIQMDAYNSVINTMQQRDQQAISENLVPQNVTTFGAGLGGSFKILVNNLGGTSVSIATVYITNIDQGGSTNCYGSSAPCIVNPAPSSTAYTLTGGNIQAGEVNHFISVGGISLNDTGTTQQVSTYRIVIATTRGRLFSLSYPFRGVSFFITNTGGNGQFVTNIGPLSIFFDYRSFNFTMGSQTQSQPAFCIPTGQSIVFWVKVANTASDTVTIRSNSAMQIQGYGVTGNGLVTTDFILNSTTLNPQNPIPYSDAQPTTLPPQPPSGPALSKVLKFGIGGASKDANYITFIGFYYIFRGQLQGETIPFIDFHASSSYPVGC